MTFLLMLLTAGAVQAMETEQLTRQFNVREGGVVIVKNDNGGISSGTKCEQDVSGRDEGVGMHTRARSGGHDLLRGMSETDRTKRIFMHQVALTGAVLNMLSKKELLEFPIQVNYPLFFDRMFKALIVFDDIGDTITLRYDAYFRNPDPDWAHQLKGPANIIAWLHEYLGK